MGIIIAVWICLIFFIGSIIATAIRAVRGTDPNTKDLPMAGKVFLVLSAISMIVIIIIVIARP